MVRCVQRGARRPCVFGLNWIVASWSCFVPSPPSDYRRRRRQRRQHQQHYTTTRHGHNSDAPLAIDPLAEARFQFPNSTAAAALPRTPAEGYIPKAPEPVVPVVVG
jgi:hypothetical protein